MEDMAPTNSPEGEGSPKRKQATSLSDQLPAVW